MGTIRNINSWEFDSADLLGVQHSVLQQTPRWHQHTDSKETVKSNGSGWVKYVTFLFNIFYCNMQKFYKHHTWELKIKESIDCFSKICSQSNTHFHWWIEIRGSENTIGSNDFSGWREKNNKGWKMSFPNTNNNALHFHNAL